MIAKSYRVWDINDRLMRNGWSLASLGQLLEKSNERVEIESTQTYKEITVRLWGRGVVLRGKKSGSEIGTTKRLRVHAGQFIFSRIDARNGAFGIIPDELEGAVVSTDFPVHNTKMDLLFPDYLDWLSRVPSFIDACRAVSEGTTNRIRLKEDKFYRIEIPLPPLSEQRRIVAKIKRLAAKIEEARGIRENLDFASVSFRKSIFQNIFKSSKYSNSHVELGDACEILGGSSFPQIDNPIGDKNILLVKVSDMNLPGNEVFLKDSVIWINKDDSIPKSLRILPKGAVIFPKRGGAIATNKKRILAKPAALDPNIMAVYPKNEKKINVVYLYQWFQTIDLAENQSGTSVPQINKKDMSPLQIPIPPMKEQLSVVEILQSFQSKIDRLNALHTKTAAELDAMLPSILHRAFKGEL